MSFKRMHKLKRLRSADVPKNLRTSKSVKLTMLNSVQLPQTFRNQIVQNDLRSSARKYASLEHISCETIVKDISYIRAIAILFVKAKTVKVVQCQSATRKFYFQKCHRICVLSTLPMLFLPLSVYASTLVTETFARIKALFSHVHFYTLYTSS